MDKNEIIRLINDAEYKTVFDLFSDANNAEIRDILLEIAYDTESMSVLGFVVFALHNTNSEFWSDLAIEILLGVFSYIEGAYSIAYYLSVKALKQNRSKENMERLLFFNKLPEKLLKDDEALKIKNEVLLMDSK
jgi:hypothetical protein